MNPREDLERWGEPPASEAELALAAELSDFLSRAAPVPPPALAGEARASRALEEMVLTVLSHCGPSNTPGPGGPGEAPPELRLALERLAGGAYVPLGWTHPRAALRDLRRVPEGADRVTLRTGDRVRLLVECGRAGYLTVFNVGPSGTLNVLWPTSLDRPTRQEAGVPLLVADIEVTPPAGLERVYAVWSARPLERAQLADLSRPKMALRDMVRVQAAVDALRPEEWHAAVLEMTHDG